jgi:hypothetical protein
MENIESIKSELEKGITLALENIAEKITRHGKKCWRAYRISASDITKHIPEAVYFRDKDWQNIAARIGSAVDIVHSFQGREYEFFYTPATVEKSYRRIFDDKNWIEIRRTFEK